MSGRRHHYIPQALLRGFGRPTGKRWNVWLYRQGTEGPVNTNTKNVGVALDFYTKEGDAKIDVEQTKLEDQYGKVLALLRKEGAEALSGPQLLVLKRFVANCFFRTARIRTILGATGIGVKTFLQKLSGDASLFENGLRHSLQDEDRLLEDLKTEVHKRDPTISEELLRKMLRERLRTINKDLANHAEALTSRLTQDFQKVAREFRFDPASLHLAAIERSGLEPQSRIEQLESQPFGVAAVQDSLALGDVVAIGVTRDGRLVDPLFPVDELLGWLMPLTSNLLAHSGPPEFLKAIDFDLINQASVELSNDFFVAQDQVPELTNAIPSIGKAETVVDKIDWNGIYEELARSVEDGTFRSERRT